MEQYGADRERLGPVNLVAARNWPPPRNAQAIDP
jgi:hypothetical protein